MPYDICDHPLGNNIEFHPTKRESQRFGFIWTRARHCSESKLRIVKLMLLDKKISAANFKKLNELADTENCNVNALVSKLISIYKKHKRK